MKPSHLSALIHFLGLLMGLSACTNNPGAGQSNVTNVLSSASTTPVSTPTTDQTLVISTASITAASASGGTATVSINLDSTQSTTQLSTLCNVIAAGGVGSSMPCVCSFSWNQTYSSGGSSVQTIARNVQTALATVQSYAATCLAPGVYPSEIPNGTQLSISLVAAPGNAAANTFAINSYVLTVGTTTPAGAFADSEGDIFDNILHYSCFGTYSKGGVVLSAFQNQNTGGTTSPNAYFANQFCTVSNGGSANCPNLNKVTSSQASYFNLYVPNSQSALQITFNSSFVCPTVAQSINGGANNYYPNDSNFALARAPSAALSVGVTANSSLSNVGNPNSVSNTCNTQVGGTANPSTPSADNGSIVSTCLGYALAPNADGTCPLFTNSSGTTLPTYHLRRYVALMPKTYDDGGTPEPTAQAVDTIYVLDRPVSFTPTAAHPAVAPSSSPSFTMLGPKPCPFAYFDHSNVIGGIPGAVINSNIPTTLPYKNKYTYPGYRGTNDSNWGGRNIDGTQFPNLDQFQSVNPSFASYGSCSAILPFFNSGINGMSLATVNQALRPLSANESTAFFSSQPQFPQHVYIRPVQPFLPHYTEDVTFSACAPQATPMTDPPLHFVKTPSGNTAWCAEYYPTENPYLGNSNGINPANVASVPIGAVANYTSHLKKNSISQSCVAVPLVLGSGGYNYTSTTQPLWANHPSGVSFESGLASATCDRTVSQAINSLTSASNFPLLASESDIEDLTWGIASDSTYSCTMTFDNASAASGASRVGTSGPTSGCCATGVVTLSSTGTAAHLETTGGNPTQASANPCGIPSY